MIDISSPDTTLYHQVPLFLSPSLSVGVIYGTRSVLQLNRRGDGDGGYFIRNSGWKTGGSRNVPDGRPLRKYKSTEGEQISNFYLFGIRRFVTYFFFTNSNTVSAKARSVHGNQLGMVLPLGTNMSLLFKKAFKSWCKCKPWTVGMRVRVTTRPNSSSNHSG
jgi:hypothetical protein